MALSTYGLMQYLLRNCLGRCWVPVMFVLLFNLNAVKNEVSKHMELKYKDIVKYQQQVASEFHEKKILMFPRKVQDIKAPFIMLREAEVKCPLIEGNKNCFGCIPQSKKSIIRKAHEEQPNLNPPAKNDLSTQTCVQLCPYTSKWSKPAKVLIANPNYKPVHSENDI